MSRPEPKIPNLVELIATTLVGVRIISEADIAEEVPQGALIHAERTRIAEALAPALVAREAAERLRIETEVRNLYAERFPDGGRIVGNLEAATLRIVQGGRS